MGLRISISMTAKIYFIAIAALFILSACQDGDVFQITRLTSTPDQSVADNPSTDSPDSVIPGKTATSESGSEVALSTVQSDSTATSGSTSDSTATETSTPTSVPAPTVTPTPVPTSTPTPLPPTASFAGDVVSGQAPLAVTFTASTDGIVDSYEWDFGDGATSNEASPVHEYTVAGVYTVRLDVTGPNGSSSDFKNGFIAVEPGPAVVLSIEPQDPVLGALETISFTSLLVDQFGNEVDSQITWTVDEAAGTITDSGEFKASTVAGDYSQALTVSTVGESGLSKTLDVSVVPGPLTVIGLTPDALSVAVNTFGKFEISPADAFGNEITDFTATWNTDPIAGSIDDVGGFISGTKSGTFSDGINVQVSSGSDRKTATVAVTVEAGPPAVITVKPSQIYVSGSASRRFTATAADEYGNDLPGIELKWTTTGGTITGDGEFFANGDHGVHEVSASISGGSDVLGTAQAEVLPASTFVVNTTTDSVDTNPGNGLCSDQSGRCSLRAAVMESNAHAGADSISVPPGTYVLTRTGYGDDNGGWGDLDVLGVLSIYGHGPELSIIDGAASDRVLHILFEGTVVEVVGVTIRNGEVNGDSWEDRGGGILNEGTLTLIDTAITKNTSKDYWGGGIWNAKTLTIIDSELSDNFAPGLGSVITNHEGARVTITRSRIFGNIAANSAATTIHNFKGTIFIEDSIISDNKSASMLWNDKDGNFRVTNSTISGNHSSNVDIWNAGDFRLTNVTIYSGASASNALFSAGRLELVNSIIMSTSAPLCFGRGYVSLGHNIASDLTCPLFDDSDQPATDALLGPLQDNGGPTETHALLPGSPAIDAGEDGSAPLTDQRGVARPVGSASDIGAYETEG
ncbi:MAG: PKD domain-containing protein [Chloroflexi bacterium]|nr:PKD domain-containing protein [Chloroflexota bacterium]